LFKRNDWFRGIYPGKNPLLSGYQVQITTGTKTEVNETSVKGLIQVDWALDPTSRNLLTRDVSASNPALVCVRGPDERAIYNLVWSRNCTAVELRYIDNDCPQRKEVYDTLYLTKAKDNTPKCKFFAGDVYRGSYSGIIPSLAGLPAVFAFGDDNRVIETSRAGFRDARWLVDSLGDLTIKDVYAQPFNFSCGPTEGKYYLDWNQDCSRVALTLLLDGCDQRRQTLNTISLVKDVSTCKFSSGQTWTGIYPGRDQTRSGAHATFHIHDNFVVDESFQIIGTQGSVDSRWQLTQGGNLDVRWLGADPKTSCPAESEALYIVQWSRECTTAQLHVVYDGCASRQAIYDGLTINQVMSTCQLLQGESYFGNFSSNRARVNVTVIGLETVAVTTVNTSLTSSWSFTDYGNLLLRDLTGACQGVAGLYNAIFSADCNTLKLVAINDTCTSRFNNYDGLILTRGSNRAFQCRTLPGDSWRGVYQGNDNVFAGRTVTFSFSSMLNAMEVSSAGSIAVSWYLNDSLVLSVGEIAELSPDASILCPAWCGKRYSLYRVQWSNDCTQISLSLISDPCTRRAQTYNGLVLTRITSPCDFYTNEEWRGVYGNGAGVVAGQAARFVFGSTLNQLNEYSRDISWNNCWLLNSNKQISAKTFSSSPPQSCEAKVEGIYAPVWADNCNTLTVWKIYDPCADRAARYESLTLQREVDNGPACGFRAGDLWEGNFSTNARLPFTGATVKVQFTDSTAIFESSSGQTKQGNWYVDRQGLLTVRDVSSKPSTIYACDSGLTAQYNLKWSWDCNTVEFRTNFDPCERRRNRMEGMTLKKVLSKCRPRRGEIWDGVVAAGKFAGQAINVTVGANGAVVLAVPTSVINARWTVDKNGFLNVVDSKSPKCEDACDPGILATYSAIYGDECNTLTLNVVSDPCAQRMNLYDNLLLTKRYKTTGDQVDVIDYETETEVQFNFGGMIPPLPCCLAPKDPACNNCSCGSSCNCGN